MTNTKNRDGAVDALSFLESIDGPLTFGRMLRSIRVGDELSQAEFAATLGISAANLSDIENDRRNVSVERAAAWAKTLGYSEPQFVRLALQAQLTAADIDLDVDVRPRASAKSHVRPAARPATKRKIAAG